MLELAAIWAIVIATLVWFVRDERRVRQARLSARAHHYATSPAYRYRAVTPVPMPLKQPPGGLSEVQRRFMEAYLRSRNET